MKSYLALLHKVLYSGTPFPTRATLKSTGQKIGARSLFAQTWRHDLELDGFPLLTTKKVFWRGVVEELSWFLRGETNAKSLAAKGVHIWDDNAGPDGELGPTYGSLWRSWAHYRGDDGEAPVDQIAYVLDGIRTVQKDPTASVGRRLIITAWRPDMVAEQKLPPCHPFASWLLRPDGTLHCSVTMRSCDILLGMPFNIASYALLTHLFCKETGTTPGELSFLFNDLHLYDNHIDQAKEQLDREPRPTPTLVIEDGYSPYVNFLKTPLNGLDVTKIRLEGYDPHPALKAEMAV